MSLSILNLDKSFGKKQIFKSFSFTFPDNGIYSISGDSGVGKTTLLRMIAGLDRDYSGEILGGGLENVAFVFQEYRLFPTLSAIENVIIPNGDIKDESLKRKAENLLSALDFKESDFDADISELSGGMKQRISIVRAFLSKAPILLLDEPSKELDPGIRKKLCEIIIEYAKSRLIILVSHHREDIDALAAIDIKI